MPRVKVIAKNKKDKKFEKPMSDFLQDVAQEYYDGVFLKMAVSGVMSWDEYMYGKIIGYKEVWKTKFLKIPIITFSWLDDYEYNDRPGFFISYRWLETGIPIWRYRGKEAIRERKKPEEKPKTIKWSKYV
jgi:hypothetical protein